MNKKKFRYDVKSESGIKVYPGKGVVLDGGFTARRLNPGLTEQKRAKITGWSRASRRRMRRFLIENSFPPGWAEFGVTLTIPGTDRENVLRNWTELRRQFFQHLKMSDFAGVWRLELQSRGLPHLHCLFGRDMSKPLRFQRRDYSVPCGLQDCKVPDKKSGEKTSECRRVKWPEHCRVYDFFADVWFHYLAKCVPLPDGYKTAVKVQNLNWLNGITEMRTGRPLAELEKECAQEPGAFGMFPESYIYWRDGSGHTVSAFRPIWQILPDARQHYKSVPHFYTTFDGRNIAGIDNARAYDMADQMRRDPDAYENPEWSGKDFTGIISPVYLDVPGVDLAGSRFGLQGAWASAVDVECRGSGYAWLRYLQDHTSKVNQSQLPEGLNIGRHWGVVGRKAFVPSECETYVDLPDSVHARVSRWVSRLVTYKRKKDGVPFGKKLGFRPACGKLGYGAQVRFVNTDTINKMLELAIELE